jgi:hypothetical protein
LEKKACCYYLLMKFRNNHHGYILRDGSDELDDIRMPDLLQYSQLVPESVSATNEEAVLFIIRAS